MVLAGDVQQITEEWFCEYPAKGFLVGKTASLGGRWYRRTTQPNTPCLPEKLESDPLTNPTQGAITYSLDGGRTWLKATQGVRVSLERISVPGEDTSGQLDINITSEGIIKDVWVSREHILDYNIATSSIVYEDLISDMIEPDA